MTSKLLIFVILAFVTLTSVKPKDSENRPPVIQKEYFNPIMKKELRLRQLEHERDCQDFEITETSIEIVNSLKDR